MKKEYFVCDLCGRTADEDTVIFGIYILAGLCGSTINLQMDPRQSTKHLCEDCIAALETYFNPKGEDIKI